MRYARVISGSVSSFRNFTVFIHCTLGHYCPGRQYCLPSKSAFKGSHIAKGMAIGYTVPSCSLPVVASIGCSLLRRSLSASIPYSCNVGALFNRSLLFCRHERHLDFTQGLDYIFILPHKVRALYIVVESYIHNMRSFGFFRTHSRRCRKIAFFCDFSKNSVYRVPVESSFV